MRTIRFALGWVAIFGAIVSSPRAASACWEGYAASVGDVELLVSRPVGMWTPDEAHRVARWGTRMSALLPPDARVAVEHGLVRCDGAGCGAVSEFEIDLDDPSEAFDEVADRFGVTATEREGARALAAKVLTVQVFAGSRKGALATKQRVIDLGGGLHGFYVAGGFPAVNEDAHVVHDGAIYRVFVGAFLDRAEATQAVRELEGHGMKAYVRDLPRGGTGVEERSYSRS